MKLNQRLSDEDFGYIYTKVPRLNVDLVIYTSDGIVLVKRAIVPWLNHFHLPGGTVYKEETLASAAIRIAKDETGLDVNPGKVLGVMEFPGEKRGGLDIHTVSIAIEAVTTGGTLTKDMNALEIGVYKTLPDPGVPEHYEFLKLHKLFN